MFQWVDRGLELYTPSADVPTLRMKLEPGICPFYICPYISGFWGKTIMAYRPPRDFPVCPLPVNYTVWFI